jgi:carboxypeptidase Taq
MLTDPRVGELLVKLEDNGARNENGDAAANIREIRRAYDRAVKLPKQLVEEMARVTTRAQGIWQEARRANDFLSFEPWLQKIVALKREEAHAIGFVHSPYDALLDEYEPGATAVEINKAFRALRDDLSPLISAIAESSRRPQHEILEREFPIEKQQTFGVAVATAIGFDFESGRLDVTAHPFCSGIGPGDCRLTTRYNLRRFTDAFFGIMHEAGHGIYEQGLDPVHSGTPLGRPASLGVHESQSRMWENQVGRSRPFWEHFFPQARQAFPVLADVVLDDFYFAINDVRPSLIRVEADEATYNMHVILRFELEQDLLTGALPAAEVPGAWNEKFKNLLGLTPPSDAVGCLQDVHWSMGGIGYFPTYTLGNMYAAQFMEQARRDLGDLDQDFRQGNFRSLKEWLNSKIHHQGQRFRAGELCGRITGRPLTHQPMIDYLRSKFQPLYAIA